MPNKIGRDIIHRWEGNPAITIDDLPFPCADISNAGAVKTDREYILLITIQNLEGNYSLYAAHSTDGEYFDVNDKPLMAPSENGPYAVHEKDGVLDGRIIPLEGVYYIVYNALGKHGFRLGLATTTDFKTVKRIGLISEPDTKAGVLFPEKIKGKYARLERPSERGSIWISFSDDLMYWGWNEVVMTPRSGFWDCDRIGAATMPIKVELGWLFIYYGVKRTSAGPLFRLGAAILDPEEPARVVGRTNVPILSPREEYERLGDVPNLVYSCGAVIEPGDELKLYYGGSNSCICIGTTKIQRLIDECLASDREY